MKTKLIIAGCIWILCSQCNAEQTQQENGFLNKVLVHDSIYKKDSFELLHILKDLMKNHESSFYNKEYYDSTQIIISIKL